MGRTLAAVLLFAASVFALVQLQGERAQLELRHYRGVDSAVPPAQSPAAIRRPLNANP